MVREPQKPIQEIYFGKTEENYYLRYQQPTSGETVVITELSLELLAEDLSQLNVVQEQGTLRDEIASQQRLHREESCWLRKYFATPSSEQVTVRVNKKEKYELWKYSQESKKREKITFEALLPLISYLERKRTPSHIIRRKNLSWKEYALLLICLEGEKGEEGKKREE